MVRVRLVEICVALCVLPSAVNLEPSHDTFCVVSARLCVVHRHGAAMRVWVCRFFLGGVAMEIGVMRRHGRPVGEVARRVRVFRNLSPAQVRQVPSCMHATMHACMHRRVTHVARIFAMVAKVYVVRLCLAARGRLVGFADTFIHLGTWRRDMSAQSIEVDRGRPFLAPPPPPQI